MAKPPVEVNAVQELKNRAMTRKARGQEHIADIVEAFIVKHAGTEEAIVEAMATSNSEKAHKFLKRLAMPGNGNTKIKDMAREAGFTAWEFMDIMKDMNAKVAMLNYFKALPELAHDIAGDARSFEDFCSTCGGNGIVTFNKGSKDERQRDCVRCQGTGVVKKSGDTDARKLVAEATGQIRQGKGASVTVNVGHVGVDSFLNELEDAKTVDITPDV